MGERIKRLEDLRKWIHGNRKKIHEAMYQDFKKPSVEVDAIELYHVLSEIKHAISSLDSWARPKKIDAPITMLGTRSYIQYEPKGLCLIIAPWNYPFSLAIGPLVSALAAGNSVIIKPSEHTPHVSALIAKLARDVFNNEVVSVFEGDAAVAQTLLQLPFDHIFFTGSPAIGKVVMKAASEYLASVTLELGGKCPAIVTDHCNINDAAERIAVAKFVNNGQTCVAPDYVLVSEKVKDQLIAKLAERTQARFSYEGDFHKSDSYCRIVNDSHFKRLKQLLDSAIQEGAKPALPPVIDERTRFMSPVILSDIMETSRLLEEEIFGPVLPVVSFKNLDQAIAFVNARPKPLATYIFSRSSKETSRVLKETSSGGACVNDSGIHFLHHHLPFGGVNTSGLGKSHGYYGFLAFSNEKPVLHQKSGFTTVRMFYPPYNNRSKKIMEWFLKLF
jgi:aldehyde dehydrogenase (NAD+)